MSEVINLVRMEVDQPLRKIRFLDRFTSGSKYNIRVEGMTPQTAIDGNFILLSEDGLNVLASCVLTDGKGEINLNAEQITIRAIRTGVGGIFCLPALIHIDDTPDDSTTSMGTLAQGNAHILSMGAAENGGADTVALHKGDKGDVGDAGLSAYQVALKEGYTGTETEWLESLKGAQGDPGEDGKDGRDGRDGTDGVSSVVEDPGDPSKKYRIAMGVNGLSQKTVAVAQGTDPNSPRINLATATELEGKQDAGDYATLGADGKVPKAQLPPIPEVGETEGTAFDGLRGKTVEADLANHVDNRQNPHEVTAAQVGAYTKSETYNREEVSNLLAPSAAHIDNRQNPHEVTAAQVGAYGKEETYNKAEVDRKIEESGGGTEEDPVFTEWRNGESVSAGIGAVSSDGVSSVALGSYSTASGGVSVALGGGSSASEEFSVALGSFSTASGKFSVALGSYSTASGKFSVALGSFSTASKENQIAIGSRVECPETADVAIRCGGLDRFTLFNGKTYPTLQSLMDARYIKPSDIPSSRYNVVTLEGSSVTLSDRAINSLTLSGGACTVAFPSIPEGYVVDCLLFLPSFKGSLTFPTGARLDDSVGDLAGADGTQDYLLSVTSLPDGSYYVTGKVLPKGGV